MKKLRSSKKTSVIVLSGLLISGYVFATELGSGGDGGEMINPLVEVKIEFPSYSTGTTFSVSLSETTDDEEEHHDEDEHHDEEEHHEEEHHDEDEHHDDDISVKTPSFGGSFESIDNLLGVTGTDYGAAAGQPVIRGMSGHRVKVLDNDSVKGGVSDLGADHPIDTDLNKVQQVEIVRGPSSLLYSNSALGGIVNVVDETISKKEFGSGD